MRISVTPETFRLAEPFTIARGTRTEVRVLTVRVEDGDVAGRGECVPYARYDETPESVAAQIGSLPGSLTRNSLQDSLPAGADEMLAEIARPLPVCADENCHDRASLADLAGKHDVINIKLDKTGGLTEADALRDIAHAQGYGIMVGCMVSTSLSMAPAMLLAQGADFVDLDGPLLLAEDRAHPLRYDAGARIRLTRSFGGSI